jgi:hypothetical protein
MIMMRARISLAGGRILNFLNNYLQEALLLVCAIIIMILIMMMFMSFNWDLGSKVILGHIYSSP